MNRRHGDGARQRRGRLRVEAVERAGLPGFDRDGGHGAAAVSTSSRQINRPFRFQAGFEQRLLSRQIVGTYRGFPRGCSGLRALAENRRSASRHAYFSAKSMPRIPDARPGR